jgi:hypothetical protein
MVFIIIVVSETRFPDVAEKSLMLDFITDIARKVIPYYNFVSKSCLYIYVSLYSEYGCFPNAYFRFYVSNCS